MNFAELENQAIARIEAIPVLSEQTRCFPWPDQPESYGKPAGSSAIFVRFAGMQMSSSEPGSRTALLQYGSLLMDCRLLVWDLRSHAGAYPLISHLVQALGGWRPDLDPPLVAKLPGFNVDRCALISRKNRLWHWSLTFKLGVVLEMCPKN